MLSFIKKFVSFLLFVFLLFGAVSCTQKQPPQEKNYEEQKALYDDIISRYTALLAAKHNGEELPLPDTAKMDAGEAAIAEALYGIVNACKDAEDAEILGYGYKDFDGNGTPELILLSKYISIRAIFTISENQPILLEADYDPEDSLKLFTDNRFLLGRSTVSDPIEEVTYYTFRVEGDKLIYDTIYGEVLDHEKKEVTEKFQIVEGTRISIDDEAFRVLDRDWEKAYYRYISIVKLEAPYIHFPLEERVADPNLPVADFSSYAAIRNTYIAISRCLETFDSYEWEMGAYDNLFSFPDDRSFEYYTQLLYIAYQSDHHMGYDEIDLNGDGQDELVLLNEDYRIKAIFTQKDGVPVLLDSFVHSYQTGWLDADGLIHVDCEGYDELMYSVYEFTTTGEYKHHYSVIADNYGRYLTKDGKMESISFEKSLEILYDGYVCYSEPFSPNEHTRSVSKLSYSPLVDPTEDPIKLAVDETWYKFANLKKTSGKDLAYSHTYVTFANATDTQLDMNLKYVYTFYYPDPDRDHYLLDDSTESTLMFTLHKENGIFVFDENGMQGSVRFGQEYLWILVEKSSDERFPVGNYCYELYSSADIIQ